MDKDQSIKLFSKGPAEWAEWTGKMREERREIEAQGKWGNGQTHIATQWLDRARVDFGGHNFSGATNFDGFTFPGDANFKGAVFFGDAIFRRTSFNGTACFAHVQFKTAACFEEAEFAGSSDFAKATIQRSAQFNQTRFWSNAHFTEVTYGLDAKFENSTFDAEADLGRSRFKGDVSFLGAKFAGVTIFFKSKFEGSAEFSSAQFHREARFRRSEFSSTADFDSVKFRATAAFSNSKFDAIAHFSNSTFEGQAEFNYVSFASTARFSRASFHNTADFDLAVFKGYTDFGRSAFSRSATFIAIKGESYFTLEDAAFTDVPDFQQAHFAESPRLDIAQIAPPNLIQRGLDQSARWRALKRLAIQAHDHEREQIFFAEEIKALRGAQDRLLPNPINLFREGAPVWQGGARYWAGLCYQAFSDFGRSMLRPILWWLITMTGAADYYLYRHLTMPDASYGTGGLTWLWHTAFGVFSYRGAQPALSCLAGHGEPISAAFYIAIRNGLVFPGLGGSEKLTQSNLCLYGETGGLPVLPDAVVYAGIAQAILSALLIFLFLIAVRNHFRIK